MIVDPYDLRPWGLSPILVDAEYPPDKTVNLIRVVARQPHDLVMFGGSTTMPFTAPRLNAVFGSKSAVNLSYMAPMPTDTAPVLLRLVETPGLKRLIVAVDFSEMRRDGDTFYLGGSAVTSLRAHWYDMPDFTRPVARASLNRLWGRAFDIPGWRGEVTALVDAPSVTTHTDYMALLNDAVSHPDPAMDAQASAIACAAYPYLTQVLLPVGRAALQRGVHIDIVFPPIPFQTYYNWQKNHLEFSSWEKGAHHRQLVGFYGCIVKTIAAAHLANVTVHATDTDRRLTDLADYRDTVHLTKSATLTAMLQDIRDRTTVVTPESLDAFGRLIDEGIADVRTWRWSDRRSSPPR
ncbi:hypothetical protein [Sphingomonas mali]|uniref:hypothetical protein n=1 Tax=Sphingomonas mali TaxID=40682 RepID=UPI0012ECE499|nr:hypothetical protein [Sphingomonas mali]